MSTPAIPGLPPGAIVKPLGTTSSSVQGLPPGAVVKPIGGTPTPAPSAPPTAEQGGDPGFLHGLSETTLGPIWQEFKRRYEESQQPKDFPTRLQEAFEDGVKTNPMIGGGLRMVANIAREAYEQGRQAAQHVGTAASQEWQGIKSLAHGDIRTAAKHGDQVMPEMLEASGHAGAAALPVLGPAAAKAGQDIGEGRPAEGAGEATGLVGQVLLGGAFGRKATKAPKLMESPEAVERLTNAVNPAADHMSKFRADLSEHLGKITDYAERNGIDLAKSGRDGFLKAMRGASEEAQNFYNKNILEPVADRVAPNGQTYAAMESRLRHLNRTTSYNPNSMAESELNVARKAEANSLREYLNQGLAKELNLKPEQIADLRAAGEVVEELADKTELAMDIEKHAANAQARSSITVHAHHGGAVPGTPVGGGRFSAAVTRGTNKVLGHPADNAINKVFQKFNAPKPAVNPEIQPPRVDPNSPNPIRTPQWATQPGETKAIGPTAADFTPDTEGASAKLQARKSQGDASKLNRNMQAAADALSKQERLRSHPLSKTRVNGSAESDASMEAVNELKSRKANGVKYIIKRPGGSTRPVMATALRPEDMSLNRGEELWKVTPGKPMERVK